MRIPKPRRWNWTWSRKRKRSAAKEVVPKKGYRRVIDYPRTGRRGWRALVPSRRLVLGTWFGAFAVVAGFLVISYALVKTPNIDNLKMPTATVYEYSDGTPFFAVGLQDRVAVPISGIPATMQHAVVSIENPTFYTDSGISPRGIARALVQDAEGKPLQGGSTITQQFVKNAYLTDQQTVGRKFTEILTSIKITQRYSKSQILDDYLNTAYFGRESYGVDAAAETYFGVPAEQITDPGRAAYLAALVNEPSVLSLTDPAAQLLLKQRWNLVLDDMVKAGYLTSAQRAAVPWPIALVPSNGVDFDAQGVNVTAMVEATNSYLDGQHAQNPAVPDAATMDAGGYVIVTTFNHAAMVAAVKSVNSGIYDKLGGSSATNPKTGAGVQIGLATVDASDGELLAMYPGRSDFDDATLAQVEPGSQMEDFNLAANIGTQVAGESKEAEGLWTLMGKVGLTQNLIADPAELPESLAKLEQDPDLALGVAPQSAARMAAAYSIFADAGAYHGLAIALSVSEDGRTLWNYRPTSTQALDQSTLVKSKALIAFQHEQAQGAWFEGKSEATVTQAGIEAAGGTEATIGGDLTAWYTGYDADIVTSVAVWNQTVDSKDRVQVRSLGGLGGVPAGSSAQWPTGVWTDYMKAVTTGAKPLLDPGAGQRFSTLPTELAPVATATASASPSPTS